MLSSSSSVAKLTDSVLERVLKLMREEYEGEYPVLCETDRCKFVEEEKSIRERLKETKESESNGKNWRGLLCLPSSQAMKCLNDAQELHQRVREDIDSKVRARLTGKSNLPPRSSWGQGFARTSEQGAGLPDNPQPLSGTITSPLNMHCSLSQLRVSEENVNDTSSETSGRSCNPPSRPRRRSPPAPPRRMVLSSNSRPSSETSSDSGSDSPRRSPSVRKPAHPPRQSRTPHSPSSLSFSSPPPGLSPLDPAMIASITQQASKLASSLVAESLSGQAQSRQRSRYSDIRTNCVNIEGSNVDGVTMNSNSSNCSGAVIHKTAVPSSRLPQPVSPL